MLYPLSYEGLSGLPPIPYGRRFPSLVVRHPRSPAPSSARWWEWALVDAAWYRSFVQDEQRG